MNPMSECSPSDSGAEWDTTIKETSVIEIMKYIIEQKFALMQPEIKIAPDSEMNINTGREVPDNNPKYLSKFLTFKNVDIQASDVSQFQLMPPTPKVQQVARPKVNIKLNSVNFL